MFSYILQSNPDRYYNLKILKISFEDTSKENEYLESLDSLSSVRSDLLLDIWIGIREYIPFEKQLDNPSDKQNTLINSIISNPELVKRAKTLLGKNYEKQNVFEYY